MGSIYTDAHGPVYQFTGPDNKRRKLRLTDLVRDQRTGEVRTGKKADVELGGFVARLEELITAVTFGRPISGELAAWVATIEKNAKLSAKLIEYGLLVRVAEPAAQVSTLGPFLDSYKAMRETSNVKASTATVYSHTIRNLKAYFGEAKELSAITAGDADEFRLKLLAPKPSGEGLAENTARRRCTMAKQFFRAAVRKGLITANPFEELSAPVKSNKDRMYFLTRDDADKILEACPSNRWKLIFALSRYAGLRTPSEHNGLRWCDVDFERGRFLVHSPKTEHHAGGESRWVPIFPELRPLLENAWHEAEPGDVYVISRQNKNITLRTQFEKILKRAGLKPWPKLFQNLRSTRQTELAAEFPIHIVCAWLGNKAAVAAEHYLQITDADFERAAAAPIGGANLAQSGVFRSVLGCSPSGIESNVNSVEHERTSETMFSRGLKVGGEGLEPATSTV